MDLDNLNIKKAKELFDCGDSCLLEYLENFIPEQLEQLYTDILNYNEIYGNGWTINDLIEMGKKDKYWKKRAENFIEKYEIDTQDYDTNFIDKYFKLRDKLLDELGIIDYLTLDSKELDESGFEEGDNIIAIDKIDEGNSFTVARVMNYNHCIELHYNNGNAWIEYSTKTSYTSWESEAYKVEWFTKDMTDTEVIDKLFDLFDEYKANNYSTDGIVRQNNLFL